MKTYAFVIVGLALGACGESGEGGAKLSIAVAPLDLPRLTDACYDLAVFNAATPAEGDLVWEKADICASRYGDSQASIAYVGTCDASGEGGQRDASVRLVLTDLCNGGDCVVPGPGGTSLDPDAWQNPCPAPDGCVVSERCRENADTPVVFNLTVLRSANQGFFDVAVNFSDVFCSAKLDCVGDDGNDIDLLHDPATGERDATVVLGFACTAGADQDTYLYMSDATITCYDASNAVVSVTTVDPSEGPGNMGTNGAVLFESASYRGSEQLEPYDKCYWNMAFGVRESQLTDHCVLSLRATASDTQLTNDRTPGDTIYPVIDWSVTLNTTPGNLSCGKHAVNADGSQVQTAYTAPTGEGFAHFVACEDPSEAGGSPGRRVCEGSIAGVNELVTFTANNGSLVANVGGVESPPYPLPSGFGLGDCCLDPCCIE